MVANEMLSLFTNLTAVNSFLETAKHRASIELRVHYGEAPPIELLVVTITAGILFCTCFTLVSAHITLVFIRYHRRQHAKNILAMARSPIDDNEVHEMEVREARRSAAPGDSSDEDFTPASKNERV